MGNFFDLDAWREQQRIAGINQKITDLQGDIEDYELYQRRRGRKHHGHR